MNIKTKLLGVTYAESFAQFTQVCITQLTAVPPSLTTSERGLFHETTPINPDSSTCNRESRVTKDMGFTTTLLKVIILVRAKVNFSHDMFLECWKQSAEKIMFSFYSA